jgi:hypothetical protein
MDKDTAAENEPAPMREAYREEEAVEAHARFIKFVGYIVIAHTLGVLSCYTVWKQFPDIDGVEGVMMSSAMIFGIGLVTALGAYVVFRTAITMSREAVSMREAAGTDDYRLSMAREKQADAVARAKNGFKPLNFSGVCFVVSTLIGISGMLSL